MKSSLWLASVILSIAMIMGAGCSRKTDGERPTKEVPVSSDEHSPGFKEWVKNPEWRRAVESRDDAESDIALPAQIDEPFLRDLVTRLLDYDDKKAEPILEKVGVLARPMLLEALRDPRYLAPPSEKFFLSRRPLQKLCGLLFHHPVVVDIDIISPLLSHKDDEVRKTAAMQLASWGFEECLPGIRLALHDSDRYVRSYALIGIRNGVTDVETTDGFREGVFDAIVNAMRKTDYDDMAPELLLVLDKPRATRILTDSEFLSADHKQVHDVLEAINGAKVLAPTTRLLRILEATREAAMRDEYPFTYAYGEALIALAATKDSEAMPPIDDALNWSVKNVVERAATAYCQVNGVDNPRAFVGLYGDPLEEFPKPIRFVSAVIVMNDEVRNGGFAQYFVNSSGDNCELALAGLRDIGDAHAARILEKAMQLFGRSGPSRNRDRRHEQLARMSEKADQELDRLNEEYYKDPDNQWVRICRYAVKHREFFEVNEK